VLATKVNTYSGTFSPCCASSGNTTACDPEPHHMVKCKSTLLEHFLKSSVEVWEPYCGDVNGGKQCVVEVPGAMRVYLKHFFKKYLVNIDFGLIILFLYSITQCKI
jgi:hypothetical protein